MDASLRRQRLSPYRPNRSPETPAGPAAAATLFDVGRASATQAVDNLDRHWRNARTFSTHNPTFLEASAVGDNIAVLWTVSWLVLAPGVTRLTAAAEWLTLIQSFTTCTVLPGFVILLGEWDRVMTGHRR